MTPIQPDFPHPSSRGSQGHLIPGCEEACLPQVPPALLATGHEAKGTKLSLVLAPQASAHFLEGKMLTLLPNSPSFFPGQVAGLT